MSDLIMPIVLLETQSVFEPFETFLLDTEFSVIYNDPTFKVIGLRDSLTPVARVLFHGDVPFAVQLNKWNVNCPTISDVRDWSSLQEGDYILSAYSLWREAWESYLDSGGCRPNMFNVHVEDYKPDFRDTNIAKSEKPVSPEFFDISLTRFLNMLKPLRAEPLTEFYRG